MNISRARRSAYRSSTWACRIASSITGIPNNCSPSVGSMPPEYGRAFCGIVLSVLPQSWNPPKLDCRSQLLVARSMKLKEKIPPVSIADVQNSPDTRRLPIDQVGIKDIRHPVRVKDKSQGEQHTIATFNMYVELPHNFKGTHMSRFVEILNQYDMEISVESFRDLVTCSSK